MSGTEICGSLSDTAFLLDLAGGVKFKLAPHMFAAVGIDIPIAFHTGSNMAYLDVLGRFIYAF